MFMFNNLGPVLGMALRFYTNVAKGLKLKLRKVWVLVPAFEEVTGDRVKNPGHKNPRLSFKKLCS